MNVIGYIKENKDFTFAEKELNKIDILIMSSLMYLDFTRIVPNNSVSISLMDAATIYLSTYSKMDISKLGFAQSGAYNILSKCYNTKRYKDIKLSNYRYITSLDTQFSALTFKVGKIKVIGFEGTDELISGWKEDAYLSFKFPVDAQKYAIAYIKEVTSILDGKIYLAGHSKGGNLALVAGMHANNLIKNRIKGIYLFDAPGLRQEQIDSLRFKNIKNKINAYIPNFSIVGLLFRHVDELQVVKSKKKNVWAHNIINWEIDDKDFVYTELDYLSQRLESSIMDWLDKYNDEERKKFVDDLFAIFKRAKINSIMDFKKQIIKKIRLVILESKKIEPKSKEVVDSLFKVLFGLFKEESSSFVKEKMAKLKH